MDKKREELSLPNYLNVKGVKKASSTSYAAKRPSGQAVPRKISLEEFASSTDQSGAQGDAANKQSQQAKKMQASPKSGKPVEKSGAAQATRRTAQGYIATSPVKPQTGSKKSASSTRAAATSQHSAKAAPARKGQVAQKAIRTRRAQAALDMTSSHIANQPRKAESDQVKKVTKINAGRLMLVLLVIAVICWGVYALASYKPENADLGSLDVGATTKMPQGVSVLGIDLGGQSKSAARTAISTAADAIVAESVVTIKLGEDSYSIKGSEVSLSYNIENVLDNALAYKPPEKGTSDVVDVTQSVSDNIFTYDKATLTRAVENIAAKFDIQPVDAVGKPAMSADHTVTFEYQQDQNGRALDVAATTEKIESIFDRGIYTAQIDGIYNSVQATITAAMLSEEIGVRGSFTTRYATIGKTSEDTKVVENRVFNIHKASDIINGCMVPPGEVWSFNTYVGPRTVPGGWKEAKGIAYGKEYVMQAGGGICQVSTTLYNALQQSKVTVTDRQAHSIPSDYVDHGLDATVDYATNLDLKFKNDTGAPLYLFVYYEDVDGRHREDITFIIYGKPLENGVTYEMRSVTTNEKKRTDVKYSEDPTIPRGYKVVTTEARSSYEAEVYLDKYLSGVLMDSQYLYTDKYAGNAEYARLGTGSPKYNSVPSGAVAVK